MIILVHGDEEYLRREELRKLQAALGSPETADLNTTVVHGRKISLEELQLACDTVPFLAPRRLIIVESLLTHLSGRRDKAASEAQKTFTQGLSEYLDRVPETTDLVFVEPTKLTRGHALFRRLQALSRAERARILLCQGKKKHDLTVWIENRVRAIGGEITREATMELSRKVQSNLRLMDQEIAKLVAYAGGERAIRPEDVRLLVPEAREVKIWPMVDALGAGNSRTAMVELHRLLDDGEHPLYLLTMIVRQYRLLLQVKELIGRGKRQAGIAKELKLQEWAADKMMRQARPYSLSQLEAIYERLLEADLSIKTGRLDPVLALDMLVAELSL